MGSRPTLARLGAGVIAAFTILSTVVAVPAPIDAGPPPFGIGNWTITGTEELRNDGLILDGNLVIQSGGSLTLYNTSLQFYCMAQGEHGITVKAGGTLRILNNSVVGSFNTFYNCLFDVDAGAIIDFQDSMFIGGGMYIAASPITVRNCTFTGSGEALAAGPCIYLESSVDIVECMFVSNYIGPAPLSGSRFIRCTFSGNGYGLEAVRASPALIDCDFNNNSVGILTDTSTISANNCTFTSSVASGILAVLMDGGSTTSIIKPTDCTFARNNIGITCTNMGYGYIMIHQLELVNCNFMDNFGGGIKWSNRWMPGETPPPSYPAPSTWTITKPCRVMNDTLAFNGSITVQSGGDLAFRRSTMRVDNIRDGENGITVNSGGSMSFLENSSLKAYNASFRYKMACRAGSAFTLSESFQRDCGWDATNKEQAGPLMETANVKVVNSTVDFNPFALNFQASRGALIEGSSLRGMAKGLVLDGSTVELVNSTVATVGTVCVSESGASVLEALNSTLDRMALEFMDAQSMVNLSWYLHVKATRGDGGPVPGANLTILDRENRTVVDMAMDAGGLVQDLVLKEASIGLGYRKEFTPHTINCSKATIFNETHITMLRSLWLVLRLADDESPLIWFANPLPGANLNTSSVMFCGTATDNMALERIELVLDGFKHFTVLDSLGERELAQVEWNMTLELEDGPHTLEAVATDPSGNTGSAGVSLTVDTLAPSVRIYSPMTGTLTNVSLTTVLGVVEPGARVRLQGDEVKTDRDRFSGVALLSEGDNLITAVAVDRAGNVNSSSIIVRLDTLPPWLEVASPEEGLRLNVGMIDVFGEMENGSQIFVNGRRVALTGAPGTYRTTIALTSELNLVSVDAVDQAGNHNVTVRRVFLDTRPPFLQVMWPPDGLQTNATALMLTGIAEGGSNLSFGSSWFEVPGNEGDRVNFTLPVNLTEGQNTLTVRARDAAGNTNMTLRHVLLDTRPPELAITEPEQGLKSRNASVYIIGQTEPGARVTVNGDEVPVGYTGAFSLEVSLSTGINRIVVRATDQAGNWHEASVNVTRLPGTGGDKPTQVAPGPDWMFILFIAISACVMSGDAYVAVRRFRRAPTGPEGGI